MFENKEMKEHRPAQEYVNSRYKSSITENTINI